MVGKDFSRVGDIARKLILIRDVSVDEWNFLLTKISTLFALVSIFLMCLVSSPATGEDVNISILILFPILMSLFLLRSFRNWLLKDVWWRTLGSIVLTVLGFFMLSGLGLSYLNFINALTAPDEVRVAAGRIERLEPRRKDSPRVFIFDGRVEIKNIPITDEEYKKLRIGDYFVSKFRVGGLGLYYRWRIDSWNRGWERRVAPGKRAEFGG